MNLSHVFGGKPLSHNVGRRGSTTRVYNEAQITGTGIDWTHKKPLLQGCLAAQAEGYPANLRAFMMGYLEFKRRNGDIGKAEQGSLDAGLSGLVGSPLVLLLEKSRNPAAVLTSITKEMSAYYKQVFLDILLREATAINSWSTMPALIEAGADVNTGNGRPLATAAGRNHAQAIDILLQKGADKHRAIRLAEKESLTDALARLQEMATPTTMAGITITTPELNLTPETTPQVTTTVEIPDPNLVVVSPAAAHTKTPPQI